jgi:hypothetical protein
MNFFVATFWALAAFFVLLMLGARPIGQTWLPY